MSKGILRVKARNSGDVTNVKIMAKHDMETGNRKDKKGNKIPAKYIQKMSISHDGRSVMEAYMGTAVSKNPYLAFSAMLMAGLDGIENKIHPGDAMDKNLYDLPPEGLEDVATVSGSLREALFALEDDREFLKKGEVFSDDLINGYIELKYEEVERYDLTPHPIEFEMYYSS